MELQNQLDYLCKSVNSLSDIPARLYHKKALVSTYAKISFLPDPISPYLSEILRQKNPVNIVVTKYFQMYGSVKKDDFTLLIGPVRKIDLDDATLTQILFLLNEPRSRLQELSDYIDSIPSDFEITKLGNILCDLNACLNHTIIKPLDIEIFHSDSDGALSKSVYEKLQRASGEIFDKDYEEETHPLERNSASIREAYQYEKNLLFLISHGQLENVEALLTNNQAVNIGKLAQNNERQVKNQTICLAVLASRAAIDGGLDVKTAYSLCDIFIQKIEQARTYSEISDISQEIIHDYTRRVNEINCGADKSPVVSHAIQYIAHNINQRIFVDDLAEELHVSRPYLSVKFKQEMGISLTDYITQQKIVEAQRLIRYTDKTLSQISNYLDFSSQSYFQHQFKRFTGETPRQYRQKSESEQ